MGYLSRNGRWVQFLVLLTCFLIHIICYLLSMDLTC